MKRFFTLLVCALLLCPQTAAAEEPKYVALTFDDGPSGRFTQRLLEGLSQRQVKATFLLCGYRIADYPRLTEELCNSVHEVGLHGYSHKNMGKMTPKEAAQEIRDTLALLPKGFSPAFLRPPGGAIGDGLKAAAKKQGLAILGWSVDPKDWATQDAGAVEAAVLNRVQDGDIILLHDMCDSSVDAALAIVDQLLARGFRFVTVSELAALRGVEPKPGRVYNRFWG